MPLARKQKLTLRRPPDSRLKLMPRGKEPRQMQLRLPESKLRRMLKESDSKLITLWLRARDQLPLLSRSVVRLMKPRSKLKQLE